MENTEQYSIFPIAHIHTDFPEKFGIPRQSGLVSALRGRIVFVPACRSAEALRGLEGFSRLWLIWQFSANAGAGWHPTVRPPRLGGNTRMGVFATRSPFRPNALGLSCVKLEELCLTGPDAPTLLVSGADLMDGTPIYDIKPYLPGVDAWPEAKGGFAASTAGYALRVVFSPPLLEKVPAQKRAALLGVLENDPRPAYQDDPARVYGLSFAGLTVRFAVENGVLTVLAVEQETGGGKIASGTGL